MLPCSDFPTFKMGIVPFVLVASSAYGLVVTALAGRVSTSMLIIPWHWELNEILALASWKRGELGISSLEKKEGE